MCDIRPGQDSETGGAGQREEGGQVTTEIGDSVGLTEL